MTKITVSTTVNNSGVVTTAAHQSGNDGFWGTLGRTIVDTRDAQIRAALIDLGWTPPAAHLPQARQADADTGRPQ